MFDDRLDAGRQLAKALVEVVLEPDLVLGLPRGGVPVAAEVAAALGLPLDVIIVQKMRTDSHPELALGAVGEGGVRVVNLDLAERLEVGETQMALLERTARYELEKRARARGNRAPIDVEGRRVILVDDGIATGATARAALEVLRAAGASHITLAVPVAAPTALTTLIDLADDVICLTSPPDFLAVGGSYRDFRPTTDAEVLRALDDAAARTNDSSIGIHGRDILVPAGWSGLPGILSVPAEAKGLVIFAHGSGSSRFSPRNRWIADRLNTAGFATLLFDLLTDVEGRIRDAVFDVELLADRLETTTNWARTHGLTADLPIGFFGASTGAAAALAAAADDPEVRTVVSRGGRPDLAWESLGLVTVPVLLIVGEEDPTVRDLNADAAEQLVSPHETIVIPNAGHLFDGPGELDQVAEASISWFEHHLAMAPST